jgi:hypothetical protein
MSLLTYEFLMLKIAPGKSNLLYLSQFLIYAEIILGFLGPIGAHQKLMHILKRIALEPFKPPQQVERSSSH